MSEPSSATTTRRPFAPGFIPQGLVSGELVPFLGAGASAYAREHQETAAMHSAASQIPLGRDLSRELAELVGFPNDEERARDDLARVASYVSATEGRGYLVDFLQRRLPCGSQPSPLHRLLASAAARSPLLIMTTNYDDLMETALMHHQDAAKASSPVEHDVLVSAVEENDYAGAVLFKSWGSDAAKIVDPSELRLSIDPANPSSLTRTLLFKMHGSIFPAGRPGSFVVTEEDYVAYLSSMEGTRLIPPLIRTLLRRRQFLFLGYALRDWNLRVLLASLRRQRKEKPPGPDDSTDADDPPEAKPGDSAHEKRSFAIARSMGEDERRIWDRRDVHIRLADFGEVVPRLELELTRLWTRP
jgi:hypothetical protein